MTTERERGLRLADAEAKKLNKRFGVRSAAHIKVEAFASAFGIKIVESKLDGALARLSAGRKPIIRVSDRPCHPGDRTFGIAHELGHHVLKHPPSRVDALCKHAQPIRQIAGTARHPEAEANTLAAGVCMPSELLAEQIAAAKPSLDVAHAIAKEYTMPLTATAIRFAELSPQSCVAIYSEGGKVVWAVPSRTFAARVPRGKQLDPASIAYKCAANENVDEPPQQLRANTWISVGDRDAEIVEHSIAVPETRGVLTLIWAPT